MNKPFTPVFVVSTGRAGSTMFMKALFKHPQVATLSYFNTKFPNNPEYNRMLMSALNLPILGDQLTKKFTPTESYRYWETFYKGFSTPFRDLTGNDVLPFTEIRSKKSLPLNLTSSRNTLFLKITGWPRIGFLKALFPEAKFIYMYRDGRSMATSLLRYQNWYGWNGTSNWRFDQLPPDLQKIWEKENYSFVALAGLHWCLLMDAYSQSKQEISPNNLLEIKYEDLCADPQKWFKKVTEFTELSFPSTFSSRLNKFRIESTNDKWKKDLTPAQQEILERVMVNHLKLWGYQV
jgi:hypothetical protein